MPVFLWLAPWLGMKTEIKDIKLHDPAQLHLSKSETAVDRLVLAEFAFGTLAGVISYVAAILTNFVEVHGSWRPLWLAICIASFICAAGLIAEGARNFGKRA
ncbi:MAG TPA: hypothetical protein VGH55_02360 [Chthoniobacterales bacterium]